MEGYLLVFIPTYYSSMMICENFSQKILPVIVCSTSGNVANYEDMIVNVAFYIV